MATLQQTLKNKQLDKWLQIAAFVMPLFTIIFWGFGAPILCYFTVGTVQLISCLINRFNLDKLIRHRSRTAYEITLLAVTMITVLFWLIRFVDGSEFDLMITLFSIFLLFFIPFMAVWYYLITESEIRLLKEVAERKEIENPQLKLSHHDQ